MKNFKNKIAFVTGASSGFGEATAYKLAENGMNLIICARRFDRIKKLAGEIKKKYKVKVLPLQLDVRKYKDVKKTIKELSKEWRKIEVLVNNAGLSRGLNKIQDGVLLDWEEMIDTNVKGLLYVTKEIIPLMLENKSGHIVNVGSIAGHEVYVAGNVYCATKHAVDALTKGMRMDLNGTRIKVSTVDPGLAETEFSIVRFRGDKTRAKTVYNGVTPLYAEDVADAIEYVVTRKDNVNIAEIILLPNAQANCSIVHRDS
jgi:3-hydroxy acid dehydrogenase / malonic semialdehyde reductase